MLLGSMQLNFNGKIVHTSNNRCMYPKQWITDTYLHLATKFMSAIDLSISTTIFMDNQSNIHEDQCGS